MGTETWQGLLATVATVFGIISGIAGVVFGIIQYRGKVAEGERANLAEQATERMAAELTAARAELSRSSQAQERLAEDEAAVLVRLRRNCCFYFDPPQPVKIGSGRPSSHGAKFVCNDSSTWPEPTSEHHEDDKGYGCVRVRAWRELHARVQNHPRRGSRKTKPVTRGTLVLLEVSKLPRETREPRAFWLWWRGPDKPDLAFLWRAYVRRFDLEHTFRFLKTTLNTVNGSSRSPSGLDRWQTPRLRHPEQADLWSWLVLLAFTQLRLARSIVEDVKLPWQRAQEPPRMTPSRVRRGFIELLPVLGTPASIPKPCGKSPGRPKGRLSGRATRFLARQRRTSNAKRLDNTPIEQQKVTLTG